MANGRTRTVLVDTTNLAADTYYYPSSSGTDMKKVLDYVGQITTSGGVTVTVEASEDDTGTNNFVDITESVTSMKLGTHSAASYVDQTDILSLHNINVRRLRWKVVTSDNTNTVKIVTIAEGDNITLSL